MLYLIKNFTKCDHPPDYLQTISRVSPDDLQNNDYQNSNIKKVGGINLKQICKINILAHDTGAENPLLLNVDKGALICEEKCK